MQAGQVGLAGAGLSGNGPKWETALVGMGLSGKAVSGKRVKWEWARQGPTEVGMGTPEWRGENTTCARNALTTNQTMSAAAKRSRRRCGRGEPH